MDNKASLSDGGQSTAPGFFQRNMSLREAMGTGAKALLGLAAARASNVLGAEDPWTYDKIMAALEKGELNYEQLFQACKNSQGLTEPQRTVLRGELAKLQLQKTKPVDSGEKKPPIIESPEAKKKRIAEEKREKETSDAIVKANKLVFNEKSWVSDTSKGGLSSIRVTGKSIKTRFERPEPNTKTSMPKSTQILRIPLMSGRLMKFNITFTGAPIYIKIRDLSGKLGDAILLTSNQDCFVRVPPGSGEGNVEIINSASATETEITSFSYESVNNNDGQKIVALNDAQGGK